VAVMVEDRVSTKDPEIVLEKALRTMTFKKNIYR
jgi:hypothetical protein